MLEVQRVPFRSPPNPTKPPNPPPQTTVMESMLNKLKSTVTKVTADVTSAVMGNPVTREFEVGRHIASGGPGMSWRIYNGTKKSTKQVCVCTCLCWNSQCVMLWCVLEQEVCDVVVVCVGTGGGSVCVG